MDERETDRDKVELVIRTREDKLRDLGPQLSKILDTTIPVQKYLELPLTDTRDQLGECSHFLNSATFMIFSRAGPAVALPAVRYVRPVFSLQSGL